MRHVEGALDRAVLLTGDSLSIILLPHECLPRSVAFAKTPSMTIAPGNIRDLVPMPFTKAMCDRVSHLSCGSTEASKQAMYWIQGDGYPSVLNALRNNTSVWLYHNLTGEPVGFGSLGTITWLLGGTSTKLQYLPMLAVFSDFQGKPPSADGTVKCCYQIVDHLLDQAEQFKLQWPLVGLSVRKTNVKAIRIYEKSGFRWVTESEKFSRMLLRLT